MRAFFTPLGIVTWLPQAIMWFLTKQKYGRAFNSYVSFDRMTKGWSQISGWIATPVSLFLASIVIVPSILDEIGLGYLILPNRGWWPFRIFAGVVFFLVEIGGWIMFYTSYKGSIQYYDYLYANYLDGYQAFWVNEHY